MPTISSHQFDQDTSSARSLADEGHVFVTDLRGQPTHVLMTIEEYRRLIGQGGSIVERLAMAPSGAESDHVEFEPPRVRIGFRAAE